MSRLEEIKARWAVVKRDKPWTPCLTELLCYFDDEGEPRVWDWDTTGRAIAASPEDIAWLVAEVERLSGGGSPPTKKEIALLYFAAERRFQEAAAGDHDGTCLGAGCSKCFLEGVEPLLDALRGRAEPGEGWADEESVPKEVVLAFQRECENIDPDSVPSYWTVAAALVAAMKVRAALREAPPQTEETT
jgi:hypothetical protein